MLSTCCFTGHRHIAPAQLPELVVRLDTAIGEAIAEGITCFFCGGALGFDTLAAEAVLRARERLPILQLVLVLPCLNQTQGWLSADAVRYRRIQQAANQVIYLSGHYTPGCMQMRNRYLVDHSSLCIAYCLRRRSGTGATVAYALETGVPVHHVSPSL